MKITTGLLAGVAVLALAQTAHAAPRVTGKYILMSFSQCQAEFTTTNTSFLKTIGAASGPGSHQHPTTTGPGVQTVNSVQNGEINIAVGSITFNVGAAGASTGTATLEMSIVSGNALRINPNNANGLIGIHPETISGTFAVTDTTFTFNPAGADPAEPTMTWTMRPGDFKTASVAGVARTMYLTRKENARCISALTATKQLP
jgi:hypothetical protein